MAMNQNVPKKERFFKQVKLTSRDEVYVGIDARAIELQDIERFSVKNNILMFLYKENKMIQLCCKKILHSMLVSAICSAPQGQNSAP
jgi:hypothetical protein